MCHLLPQSSQYANFHEYKNNLTCIELKFTNHDLWDCGEKLSGGVQHCVSAGAGDAVIEKAVGLFFCGLLLANSQRETGYVQSNMLNAKKKTHCRAVLSLSRADVMFKMCVCPVCFHLLTIAPYLSDLAVRLSGFHHTLISAQQTHPFTYTVHTHKYTYKQTLNGYLTAFLITLYSKVETTFSHLRGQLIKPCDTFKAFSLLLSIL